MAKIKDYWQIITIALGVLVFGWWLKGIDTKASEAKEIARQQADISAKLSAIVIQNDTKLGVYLELMGFDDSIAREWAELPRTAPHDSLGKPIPWEPWLRTDSALQVGERMMFNDSGTVLIDTIWSFRSKK
jgi:hypothetical protein